MNDLISALAYIGIIVLIVFIAYLASIHAYTILAVGAVILFISWALINKRSYKY